LIEQVVSAPYTTTRLNLPESFSNGRTYQVQYGRRLVLGGAGEQTTTLRVSAGAFTTASLDALISEVGSGSLTFRLDIGNDGAWDWEWTGNVDSATTLTNTGLAAVFNAYWASHGAPLTGTVDVPVKVSLSKGGQVLLTNLQMIPTGSKVRYLRLPARSYSTVTLQFTVNNGDPNPGPLTVAADVGDNGTVDWTYTGSPAYPATLTTGNLASAVNAYLSGRSGEVDVPIRFYVAPFLALGLRDFAATPTDRPDAGLIAADIAFGASTPTEGATVPVTATLHNTATLDSGPLTASFFAAAPGWGEWYIGSAFVPNIPAGGTAQARISWNTLGFTGTVPVRVVADPYNRLAETSESNNVATATLTIRTRPDLQVTGIVLSNDEPVAGETVTVTLTLRNNGQTTAGTQTVVLYQGNPDAGGTVVGAQGLAPLQGGNTTTVAFAWTPAAPGPYRLFARADRDNAVNEYDEGNNDAWRDVYVGLRGPILLDSGGASDVAYTPERGYGYVDEGQPDVTPACGSQGYETLRLDPGGQVIYRFDHLLPGHFYHLDMTLYECDGAGRQESIYVDGNLIAGPEDLSDGRAHRLSLRLDPALYADRGIVVSVEAPGIDGAVVGEVNLHDIDYRYADAGGQADPQYPGGPWAGLGRPYGWLEGVPNTAWGTLPYQSVRVNQGGNTLRYRFDGLNPARQYQVSLTFWQPSGTARIQKVQIDGADTGLTVNTGDYQVHRVTVDVPASAYASDGSIVVGIVRTNAATGAFVNEIALEELTAVLPPVADFTASPTEGYAPLTVQFIDRSSGAITGRSWAFGDGGSDTVPNPVHTYNNPGVYTVTLTVYGPGGSHTLTRPNYITVTSIPVTATVVSIDPSTAQANPSVPITVAVAISNVTNLGSFQFTLAYSPTLVTVQNITLGEFPGSTGRSFTPVGPNIDNNAGTATFGAFSLGATPAGPSGSGALAYVRLLPQAGGTAALVLSGAQVANASGQSVQVVTRNGTLFITACLGDFDGDGDVDILDVQRIAYRWNSHRGDALYEPAYDLDSDGDIDILDVQQVAYRWGTRCGQAAGLEARPTQVQTPVALSVQPYSRTVIAGQVFTVGIVVSDVVDLGGFEFTLAYSPTVVQVVSATVGAFPGSTGRTFTPLGPNVDSVAGTVSFGAFSLGATPQGASGSGTLAVLTLRALAEGESGLLFRSAQVSDRSGSPQPVGNMAGGRVAVTPGQKVFLPLVLKSR
jgi:PKD repeat protein